MRHPRVLRVGGLMVVLVGPVPRRIPMAPQPLILVALLLPAGFGYYHRLQAPARQPPPVHQRSRLPQTLALLVLLEVCPGGRPVEQPVERSVGHLVKCPMEHPGVRPVEHPMEHPVELPAEHLMERPMDRPMDRPVEQPVEHPVERPMEYPVDQPMERPVEYLVERPKEHPVELPMECLVERPKGRPMEHPREHPKERLKVSRYRVIRSFVKLVDLEVRFK